MWMNELARNTPTADSTIGSHNESNVTIFSSSYPKLRLHAERK
jgi:hypothetical protein